MILVIGGQGAGKGAFVRDVLGVPGTGPDGGELEKVVWALEERDPLPSFNELCQAEVVVCQEVGCGVVPMDSSERRRREEIGRLCCRLAQVAQAVYRLSCGIPMRLK